MPEDHLFPTRIVEFEKESYNHPVVFGGFVGPSLVGIISASYLIEQLSLHQVAHVSSQHIPPVAVFVGGKLRHPFRIYRDGSGSLILMICEVPIGTTGLYEIGNALLDWLEKLQPKEIVILDGIPVQGVPEKRETFCVAGDAKSKELKSIGLKVAQSALISGMGGCLLSECLSRRIEGISLLTQASAELPDPGAVLTLVNSLNLVFKLNVSTSVLEQNVIQLDKELSQIGEQYQKIVENQERTGEAKSAMYK